MSDLRTSLGVTTQFLSKTFGVQAPKVAVVLGSGLGAFTDALENPKSIQTSMIPGAVASSVVGHDGRLFVAEVSGKSVAVVAGRVHGFEGHEPAQVVHLLRALRLWGVEIFVLTNATGSTKKIFKPGSINLIKDHINFTGKNPLVGLELFGGERFPDMTNVWDKDLRSLARAAARKAKLSPLKEVVYTGVLGPSFETAAEIQMIAKWGGDVVGMSTVWEAIALHQMKARVVGLSVVTNFGTGVSKKPLGHEEVLEIGKRIKKKFAHFLTEILKQIH